MRIQEVIDEDVMAALALGDRIGEQSVIDPHVLLTQSTHTGVHVV